MSYIPHEYWTAITNGILTTLFWPRYLDQPGISTWCYVQGAKFRFNSPHNIAPTEYVAVQQGTTAWVKPDQP